MWIFWRFRILMESFFVLLVVFNVEGDILAALPELIAVSTFILSSLCQFKYLYRTQIKNWRKLDKIEN